MKGLRMSCDVDEVMEGLENELCYRFFSLSSVEERKLPETFVLCLGTIPSEIARQENSFLVLRRIVLTLVTLHVQDYLRGLIKIVDNDPRQCTR